MACLSRLTGRLQATSGVQGNGMMVSGSNHTEYSATFFLQMYHTICEQLPDARAGEPRDLLADNPGRPPTIRMDVM